MCAHLSVSGQERRSHYMLGARHQAASSLRACDRLPSARLQPLDAFAGGSRGSPLLPCDTAQTDPACSTRNPADHAVGETSRTCDVSLKTGSVPAGVSMHERVPCICWGPGDMKQGASQRSTSQRVKQPKFNDKERPGRHLLPFLKLSPAGDEPCW